MRSRLRRLFGIDPEAHSDRILLLFLCTDLTLIALYILHVNTDLFSSPNYSIARERGFGETFQYFKEGWITLSLVVLAVSVRRAHYAVWGLLFTAMLADDLMAIHEGMGKLLGRELGIAAPLGLNPENFGELVTYGIYAAMLLIPIGAARVLSGADGSFWRSMLAFLVILVALGVGVDVVHTAVLSQPWVSRPLAFVEEGGEMLVMSFIFRFVFREWHEQTR